MQYIAQCYAPELLGGSPERCAEIDMVYAQLKECKQSITGPCYTGGDRRKLTELAKQKMKPIVEYLGKKEYLFGAELSFLDFYMLEQCEFVEWLTEQTFLSENKPLGRYIKRMKGQKKVKAYMRSDKFKEVGLFNNTSAKINGPLN